MQYLEGRPLRSSDSFENNTANIAGKNRCLDEVPRTPQAKCYRTGARVRGIAGVADFNMDQEDGIRVCRLFREPFQGINAVQAGDPIGHLLFFE